MVLIGADLTGADLFSADLTYTMGLTQDQLQAANGDEGTRLPEGFIRPGRWIRRLPDSVDPAAGGGDDSG